MRENIDTGLFRRCEAEFVYRIALGMREEIGKLPKLGEKAQRKLMENLVEVVARHLGGHADAGVVDGEPIYQVLGFAQGEDGGDDEELIHGIPRGLPELMAEVLDRLQGDPPVPATRRAPRPREPAATQPGSADRQVVQDVERLLNEANSGASFEQYFRWASLEELGRIDGQLARLGLDRARELTAQAMKVAFPKGIPGTVEALEAATDWTPRQEQRLSALFADFEGENPRITEAVAAFAKGAGLA